MSAITIRPFRFEDLDAVLTVILDIQRGEFGLEITADAQPDLAVIPDFYQTGHGQFWVAERDGAILGTLGLKDIGDRQAALRKMFVSAPARGREAGVAGALLSTLLAHAQEHGLGEIFLGTTDRFLAAHRFYEKNGFVAIEQVDLPRSFPVMAVDNRFYRLQLVELHSGVTKAR